ncbi:FtsK/SpoIIIE domain-containing protein [Galactobacillus timonensis]|uniref:FtsK/SpoIIIE domain-containing protein n=1 Tax=Galactobacillus timonensis TaxID=2041840 RepID=UPI000C823ACA|nr:FtsK/SpoIIIE domain-containing protein [Galactobacillus timonensis]
MSRFLIWAWHGLLKATHDIKKAGGLAGYLTLMAWLVTHSDKVFHIDNHNTIELTGLLIVEYRLMLIMAMIIGAFVILILYGMPIQAIGKTKALERIGMKNHRGEIPCLVGYKREGRIEQYEFTSCGIPLEDWEKHQVDLEAILNLMIDQFKYTHGTRHVVITAVSAVNALPDMIRWTDWNIPPGDFLLALGEGIAGKKTVDLAISNSILIGGSTGSGKSVLLRSLLYQAYRKGADIILADFKGGVDYTDVWSKICTIIVDPDTLETQLQLMVKELEERKILFKKEQVRNIREYNKVHPEKRIKRVIFACDEVAELLDKTGADKSRKEQITRIEGYLSTIARQGRAFGLHLILATQRPDANILTGQIKNNIDCRICGTADNVLSMIILDNTEAADKVPRDVQGRFITREGIIFQGYYLTDEDVENGSY